MTPVEVAPIADKTGVDAFISAARRAQAGNPRWVEPIHDEIRMIFDSKRAPFMRQHIVQPFVAFRGADPVGRIVATIDSRHIAKFNDGCGFFGFIEAIDDAEVFGALFRAAEEFLKNRGVRIVRGPFSLTINHESGLLVHGFDAPHVVRTNHAPPHYARHIEALGYSKAVDLLAYACRPSESSLPERLQRILSASDAPPVEFHSLSLTSWGRDIARVLALYNDAWSDNSWATPVSADEAKLIARMMLPVSRPGWIRIATFAGEDVAVAAQIPDVNEALAGLHGRLWPFGFARLLWGVHVRGPRRTRAPITGVAKKWRNTRVAAFAVSGLVARSIEDARKAGVEEIEYSWMLETNESALNGVRRLPARHTRTFRVYEKRL